MQDCPDLEGFSLVSPDFFTFFNKAHRLPLVPGVAERGKNLTVAPCNRQKVNQPWVEAVKVPKVPEPDCSIAAVV
jgi:hypothetical protein